MKKGFLLILEKVLGEENLWNTYYLLGTYSKVIPRLQDRILLPAFAHLYLR